MKAQEIINICDRKEKLNWKSLYVRFDKELEKEVRGKYERVDNKRFKARCSED